MLRRVSGNRAQNIKDAVLHHAGPPVAAMRKWLHRSPTSEQFVADSSLEEDGFELVWGFSCQVIIFGLLPVLCSEQGKAVLRPVACDQVPGARGWGQGTDTLAQLGGLPLSGACVSQRLDA
jgi:hypothetical protein